MRIIVWLCVPTERITEYESDKDEVEESEWVESEVREECES